MADQAHCIVASSADVFGLVTRSFTTNVCWTGSLSFWMEKPGRIFGQKEQGNSSIKARKSKYLERYYLFSENIPLGWTVPFELFPELPGFHPNGKRSLTMKHLVQHKIKSEVPLTSFQLPFKWRHFRPLPFTDSAERHIARSFGYSARRKNQSSVELSWSAIFLA